MYFGIEGTCQDLSCISALFGNIFLKLFLCSSLCRVVGGWVLSFGLWPIVGILLVNWSAVGPIPRDLFGLERLRLL